MESDGMMVITSQHNYGDNKKPGRCPAVPSDPKGPCVDLPICSVDSDCYGVQKCCPNGCGHECLFPVDPKPGICPPSGGGTCAEHCSKDSDCQDVQKCCSNGCGHDCFFPVTVKPGTCPTLPPDTVGTCVDLCTVDSDCLGDQKCCSHGCGHSCSSTVNVCPPEPKCPVPPNGPPGTCKPQCKFEYNVINELRCRVKCVIGPQGPQGPPCPPTGCPGAGIPEPPAQQGFSGALLGGERSKPGTCPVLQPGSGGTCVEKCRTDSDCPWKLKCCSSGCGHICQYPGPIPTCAPACDKSCPFGFVLDENNCPICECKTGNTLYIVLILILTTSRYRKKWYECQ
ncbi:WAP four-disulfide core domain protein 3-like [Mytilus edulis]|uniref:WAP four-disulfide core domain protein 3-like n=1 Tax=Mytilus edulis TaxID=6550 RepID=UPI0039F078B6